MKKIKKLLLPALLASCLLANTAQANQWCYTTVRNLFVSSDGTVYILPNIRGDYVAVCNITSTWKGVVPTICATWISLLRSATIRKTEMIFFYNEPTVCTAIPNYSYAPAPGYIMMID